MVTDRLTDRMGSASILSVKRFHHHEHNVKRWNGVYQGDGDDLAMCKQALTDARFYAGDSDGILTFRDISSDRFCYFPLFFKRIHILWYYVLHARKT